MVGQIPPVQEIGDLGMLFDSLFDLLFKPNVEKLAAKGNVKGLLKALRYKRDENVRRNAVTALGAIGDEQAIEPLIQLLADCDSGLHGRVISALENIIEGLSEKGDVNRLIEILMTEIVELRRAVAVVLGDMRDSRAVQPLIDILDDKDVEVRESTIIALGTIGDAQAIEPLIQLLADCDSGLHGRVISALESIIEISIYGGGIRTLENTFKCINYNKLETLGIQKTSEEQKPLVFKRNCYKCQKKTFHIYYNMQFNFSHADRVIYSKRLEYFECGDCGIVSDFFIACITIDPRTITKINSIIPDGLSELSGGATFVDLIELTNKIEESNMDKNLIEMIRRIKNQVINIDATICYYCGNKVGISKRCRFCNLVVCKEHIVPESHGCKGIKPPNGIREIISGGKTTYTSDLPGVGEG